MNSFLNDFRDSRTADFITALLLFTATTFLSGIYSYLCLIIFSMLLFLYSDLSLIKRNKAVFWAFSFLFLTQCIFLIFDYVNTERLDISYGNPFLGFISFILMIMVTKSLNRRVIFYVVYLICFEVFIAVFEHIIGQPYITPLQLKASVNEIGSLQSFDAHSTDFYNNSVYGLGSTSSSLSFKLIFFLLVCKAVGIKLSRIVILLFVLGSVLAFSRMAIFCLLVYFVIEFSKNRYAVLISPLLIAILIFVIYSFSNVFLKGYQLDIDTLLSDKVLNAITSSRYTIWNAYIENAPKNWLLGYYGETKAFDVGYVVTTNPHNTYLYLFFKQGFAGLFLYMLSLYSAFYSANKLYLLPLLLYSITSVTLGFYFSIYDVVIFYLLFNIDNFKDGSKE
ncbi:O-antigen ligase family protein [Pseudoalteromonas sp. S3776]|uniref:O-antigen ligase family protein n=1 Tax=Pseudoalteromonas sp. S3776 TaxID=579544 RepID=UPI001109115E|nr:O-antigen ligase family protein [Pseudoalteromonas sp. S3776]